MVKIIRCASAKSSTDESETLSVTCTRFLNSKNVRMAQYKLVHQFKELGFSDIGFEQSTVQALYIGNFLYSNSSTPSNFTVFVFRELETLLDSSQNDYPICQPVRTQGEKKLLDKIKTSPKQTVHVPTDFNSKGTQLQNFTSGCEIFFGDKSACSTSLRKLLITVGKNKKTFQDHIALDDLFVAKFLLTIDQRFQCWLGMCKHVVVSRSQVGVRVLQFDNTIEDILNGQFNMKLPATFKKIKQKPSNIDPPKDSKGGDGGKGAPGRNGQKKRKLNQEIAGIVARNDKQVKEFKMKDRETWETHFRSQCPKKCPNWNKDVKMCVRWHIKGDCYNTYPRAISHVPGHKVPPKQKADFLGFMKECREFIANNKKD
jgi:hypothetical protein